MAKILYGKPVREKMIEEMKGRVASLGFSPCLAILQVGEREDSTAYIKQKQKFGEQIGVKVILKQWMNGNLRDDEAGMEEEIINEIERLNNDKSINGIIVQLPLPEYLDTEKILNKVEITKDADGLATLPLTRGGAGGEVTVPATARAILALLDYYEIDVQSKKVAVIGRSRLVGAPTAELLRQRGAEIFVCHRGTSDTASVCRSCDIVIVAAGSPNLVTKDFVKPEQVVVDVGINRIIPLTPFTLKGEPEKSRLVGDVNFEEVEPIVRALTPVPGGVGPLTVACLFQNLVDLCYNNRESF